MPVRALRPTLFRPHNIILQSNPHLVSLAKIGLACGLDGVVCSVREAAQLRKKFGREFVLVPPGIRPNAGKKDDQKRTATVKDAILAGSHYLVIGRPILAAKDPLKAAREIMGSIKDCNCLPKRI